MIVDPYWNSTSILAVLDRLNLRTNLKLALDVGEGASYPGSGQKWLDLSGNGYDFFRGVDNTATTDDPTFNGTSGGLTSGEYWGFDGGDYFTYDTTNETWMENLHKNNAIFTMLAWLRIGATGAVNLGFMGDRAGTTNTGISFQKSTADQLQIAVNNAGVSVLQVSDTSVTIPATTWTMIWVSLNEATGASGGIIGLNGNAGTTFNSTYSDPSDVNASFTFQIAARGSASVPLDNNSRMAIACVWEGSALTQAQISSIFTATRNRFGV